MKTRNPTTAAGGILVYNSRLLGLVVCAHEHNRVMDERESEITELRKDARRLDWLEQTASGIQWQMDHTGPITREAIDRALSRAEADETDDTAEEIQRIARNYGPTNNTDPSENHP